MLIELVILCPAEIVCLACSFLSIRAELHNEDDRVQLQVGAEALKMRVMQLHPCEAPAEDTQEWFFYSERNHVESKNRRSVVYHAVSKLVILHNFCSSYCLSLVLFGKQFVLLPP